jgi:ABC-type uncharacterized transport system fused permease/ATPase subunit
MFLPRSPHFAQGNLKDQIIYPYGNDKQDLSDVLLLSLLQDVGLDHLVDLSQTDYGIHQVRNWKDLLSSGEQQRLMICRILYHRPKLVFLDESTSDMDAPSVLHFYQLLRHGHIGYVTISHQNFLIGVHDLHLHLDGQTNWRLSTL